MCTAKEFDAAIWVSVIAGILFTVYGIRYIVHGPSELPDSIDGQTMYVFSHEGTVAKLTEIANLSPHKKNRGQKFYIPETCGRLEPHKTYDFYKDVNGNFCVRQVAVLIS